MITKEQWSHACKEISRRRAEGKELYVKDFKEDNKIIVCDHRNSIILMSDGTALTHESFSSVKALCRNICWVEIKNLTLIY